MRVIEEHLRQSGREGLEGVALLAGPPEPVGSRTALLNTVILPQQVAHRSVLGVAVEILPEEAARLAIELALRGLVLFMKFHSHPREAYHSHVDDQNMLMRFAGAVSVVVPDFARAPLKGLGRCAGFRFSGEDWEWHGLGRLRDTIQIIDWEEVQVIDRRH